MSLSELANDFSQYRKSFLSDNTQKQSQNTKILPLDIDLIYLFSGSTQIQNVNCLMKCEYCPSGCELCEYKGERFQNFNTQIIIDKGIKDGDVIPFLDNNNQPYRYAFKINEINTSSFIRKGHNLYYTHNISLKDAIGNFLITFPFIDNTTISYQSNELITMKSLKVIKGKGMPVRYRSGMYGDLIISYNIVFPRHLSDENRLSISSYLPSELPVCDDNKDDNSDKLISDTELDIKVESSSIDSTTDSDQCVIM